MKKKKQPSSLTSERVRQAERNMVEAGWRRTPNGMLPKLAVDALARLMAAGYAPSETKAIGRALMEAADRSESPSKRSAHKNRN